MRHFSFYLLLAALFAHADAQATAVARIRGSTGTGSQVSGSVTFTQAGSDPLSDVTVSVSLTGLPPGQHGFHIHQFGDVRVTNTLASMAAHFVPQCAFEIVVNPDGSVSENKPCKNDQKHGLPPSIVRQPGDMGNLDVTSTGASTTTVAIGQKKMSLSDSLRSIIGRTVLIHANVDDGTQPYGNAGPPIAYGVLGIASSDSGANAAKAPSVPEVDKVICTFEGSSNTKGITGSALLSLEQPYRPGVARFQAVISGLASSSSHSFHFHQWGDMTINEPWASGLGAIYSQNGIVVEKLLVNSSGYGIIDQEFETQTLLEHVGRSLTIHQGGESSTPTIAVAVCGLAHPHAKLDTSNAASVYALSGRMIAMIVVCILVCVAVLIYVVHKKCVRLPCLPSGGMHFSEVPPPPPPPYAGGVEMAGNKA